VTHILLLAFLFAPQDKPAAEKCTISGTVISSVTGETLNKVQILAEGPGDDSRAMLSTTTDAKGNFTLTDLAPGQYRLKGQRNGYLETYYGRPQAEGRGTPITLAAGQQITGLQFKLLPFGVIAGTIRDVDGEPLAAAKVMLYAFKFERGRRRVSAMSQGATDDLGQYRISELSPGKYLVRAEVERSAMFHNRAAEYSPKSGTPPPILVPSFYPGVRDAAAARAVEIGAGTRVTGVDITLPYSSTTLVKGRAIVPAGTLLDSISLNYSNSTDDGSDAIGFQLQAKRSPNGDFNFPAVPPGSYLLTAIARAPAKPSSNIFELMFYRTEYRASIPVQVSDLPLEGLRIVVDAGSEVEGHITVDGDEKLKLDGSIVTFDDGKTGPTFARIGDDRKFTVGLSAGHYNVYLERRDLLIRSVSIEGRNIFDEGLTVSAPAKIALEIVLARDGGRLEGVVLDKEEKPVPGATVVLIPDPKLRSRPDLFREAKTDQNGRYLIPNIRPGEYSVFAWDDVAPGAWWDPDFFKDYEKKGEPVTIKVSGHAAVKLHIL